MQTGLPSATFEPRDAQRVRYVVTFYPWLQGLRFLPLSVLFLGWGIWASLPLTTTRDEFIREMFTLSVASGVAVLVSLPITRWYTQRFGVVRPKRSTQWSLGLLLAVGVASGVTVGALVARAEPALGSGVDGTDLPGTGALFLVMAAGLTATWLRSGRVASSHLVGAVGMGLYGLVTLIAGSPMCGLLGALPFATTARCGLASIIVPLSVFMVVAAVMDHRLLVRTLGARASEEEPA